MDIFDLNGRRAHVTTALGHTQAHDIAEAGFLHVEVAIYENINDQEIWTGSAFEGEIPLAELARWALAKGYLTLDVYENAARRLTERRRLFQESP